jgi:hypothetical protein
MFGNTSPAIDELGQGNWVQLPSLQAFSRSFAGEEALFRAIKGPGGS